MSRSIKRKRPRRSHVGKITKRERSRIKRKAKAEQKAREDYWERRGTPARLRAEVKDPEKKALAALELANFKLKKQVAKPKPRGHRGQRR